MKTTEQKIISILLLVGGTIHFRAIRSVALLEADRFSAASRLHRIQTRKHQTFRPVPASQKTAAFSSASDNESTEWNLPESPLTMASHNQHYYMHPKNHPPDSSSPAVDVEQAVLEESLLSQHTDMESLFSKKTNEQDSGPRETTRLAASIDQSIYQFNTNLVNILSKVLSTLYPMSLEEQSSLLSPLLGMEYNHAEKVLKFSKFYILETVARIPYFAYLSVLHLRETFGDRGIRFETTPDKNANEKRIETMRIHYAQADNELHHLLIMEALGGNARALDRFLAHALAFGYYWFVVLVFLWNEQACYHMNELVENHAFNTYDEFLSNYDNELKALPVPDVAKQYYESDYRKNSYLFDAFCVVAKSSRTQSTSNGQIVNPRRDNGPREMNSLYDVFMNIRDDEREHWMSLCNIVQYGEMDAVDEVNVKSTNVNWHHIDGE